MAKDADRNLPVLKVDGKDETTVGNYFVSNYPPYSFWAADHRPRVDAVLDNPPLADTPMGLYIHIPFCRKRCDFCYFKVYTDKNAAQIRRYMDAVIAEMKQLAQRPLIAGRPLDFVYFGGGTPSYLSVEQLEYLFNGLQEALPWTDASEIAFECEPGTLQEKKIRALHRLGITRLSLGIENFNPEILELNNRAHRDKEIHKAYTIARDTGFEQINVDLIAGMMGETDENWADCIERTIELAPESVTIYQMEIPYNTTIYGRMKDGQKRVAPVADWTTKRRWVSEGFDRLIEHGYSISSAYTAIRSPEIGFQYRDALWHGADMIGIGVSSISHASGVHYQNLHQFDEYVECIEGGNLPIHRALPLSDDERLIRELILQMKLGSVDLAYFRRKFNVEVAERYASVLSSLKDRGMVSFDSESIRLSRGGLLEVDGLLPGFFLDQHRDARYA